MKKNKKSFLNYILVGIIIILVIFIIIMFFVNKKTLTPDYAPGVIDVNAIKTPDNEKKLDKSDGGGSVSLSYSNVVSIDLSTKEIKMYFKNPTKSTQSMIIQVMLKNNDDYLVIGQTNRIPSGYSVYKTQLLDVVKLEKGGYDGMFNVLYYDEETEEKAIVNTNIPITIDVK